MTDKLVVTAVPRTISRLDKEVRISATLVLRPGTVDDAAQGKNSQLFETWPTTIQKLFAAPGALTAELGATTAAGKLSQAIKPITSTGRLDHPDIGKDSGFAGLKFADVTTIWSRLLRDDSGGMTGLRTALKDTTPDFDHPDQPDHPYKDVLQDTNGTPNIVGMPRTELAQQITMARARVLIERVNGRAPSRKAFLGEGAYLQRPWARAATANERLALDSLIRQPDTGTAGFTPDGTPTIFAADALPPPGETEYNPHRYYDDHFHQPSPDKQWAEVKEFLVTQRKDKDTIYEATLATEQGSAKEIHDAEHNLATDGSNKREALGKIRAKRAGHQTMQQAVESATNGRANVDCKFLHLLDAATLEDYGDVPDPKRHTADGAVDDHDDLQKADDARRRWFALLGFPALQHLFLLSVDVEFSFSSSEFDKLLTAAVTTSDFVVKKEHAIFMLLRPHIDEKAHPLEHVKLSEQPWTLAKARRSFGAGPDCFMPATLEELLECYPDDGAPNSAQSLRERGTIDQFNGVIDLEAAAVSGNESSLRFSIETIDIHAAAESDMRRDAAMASAADLTAPDGASIPPIPEVTAGAAVERKLRTAGLQLLDQWRGSVVVKQFSRSLAATKPGAGTLVLDADDLAVGYRLDVGFRTGEKSELSWACLTNREVRYSLPGSTQALDKAVETILAAPNVDVGKKRVELDGSVLAMPTRLLQNANGKKTGFAESVLATWQGDPLGLEANEQRVGVCPGGLALNVDFNLPSGQSDERPPKLRFGVPYWLGARTVFLGGVCLPLHDKNPSRLTAHNLYKAGLQDGMLLPRRQELRRFLRHEWIDPPMVAVPWADIVSELGITAKPVGEKEPTAGQSPEKYCRGLDGETMVVRLPTPTPASAADEPDDPWRFKPLKSQRAVCAPGVDFTFAHLHGVFDAEVNPTKKSGLAGVDYDLSRGGFPAISPEAAIEEASIVYARTNCDQKPASGIAIFRGRKFPQPTRAAELYYPDPAA
ncbi:MAG: hypothetical protein QOF14_1935, partial [Hyphomicrobiales bacterium]|nr:hypothetical protein [Hyphomicrobiales bacterium]